jgi:geranyl-CoA carboxylase alpha subunit
MPFSKILIANRGEIACRIIRTARAAGYATVAVYSDADAAAPHVAPADQAIRIGESPAAASYLRIDALIAAAQKTGADAIHPGYGFLSENADFAQACADHNIVFIGPSAAAIRIMGDKSRAKARMVEAGVPVVPWSSIATLEAAEKLGYPIMVKAVAGGGGRGMRVVRNAADVTNAIAAAAREAQSAFGDGTLMLEKLIEHGRHIEFQIFADAHGNIIHLGERDCTAQRRRQKIIEESPSLALTPALRARMGHCAIEAARAVNYLGAGTIEFILDSSDNFYFLEMNTRLQVEHPVTECVTNLDLVDWQLRIATGEILPLTQDQVIFTGHAIEARLCAEDPYDDFAPQTGKVAYFRPQAAAIRIESGITEGGDITPYYDSMVAKFIAHGATRADAIRRLVAALGAAPLIGPPTNAGFLKALLQSSEFTEARLHTGSIDGWTGTEILRRPDSPFETIALAAAILAAPTDGFRNRAAAAYTLTLLTETGPRELRVTTAPGGLVTVANGQSAATIKILKIDGEKIRFEHDGIGGHCIAIRDGATLHLAVGGAVHRVTEPAAHEAAATETDPTKIITPVAGTLLSILPAGTQIAAGDIVAVIEAMKIETRIAASVAGTIAHIHAAAGTQVAAKQHLADLGPLEPS